MIQHWQRMGRIFIAQGQHPWMRSHASVPFAEPLDGTLCRIFFTPRDEANRSHIGWLVIDLERPDRVLDLGSDPLLAPGALGHFDDCGAMMSWIAYNEGRRYLFYTGWNIRAPVHFQNAVGLAEIMDRGGNLAATRLSDAPILDRGPCDPFFCSTATGLRTSIGWRLWYIAGTGWREVEPGERWPRPRYRLHQAACSSLGDWRERATIAIDFEHPGEVAIARASVMSDPDVWRMWYCFRGDDWPYRLGYAESADGVAWTRRDDTVVLTGPTGEWESDMQCYPHVFDQAGQRFMVYGGNGYTRGGIGLAVLNNAG